VEPLPPEKCDVSTVLVQVSGHPVDQRLGVVSGRPVPGQRRQVQSRRSADPGAVWACPGPTPVGCSDSAIQRIGMGLDIELGKPGQLTGPSSRTAPVGPGRGASREQRDLAGPGFAPSLPSRKRRRRPTDRLVGSS